MPLRARPTSDSNGDCSLVVVALVRHVGLSVGAWDTWGRAEVLLGLSVLGSSKQKGVRTYYNLIIRIERGKGTREL